ncbi:MAG: hypothetical protein N3H31_01095 [Candidatus Nezhaarchaeota archaeon]|nr:hypothetical protein [Candidatus Nezhaarchaeota archaeon]
MEETRALLREAFLNSLPYLAEPKLAESFINSLASKCRNAHEALRELERLATEGSVNQILLLTDLRILANSLRRLLAPKQGKQLVGYG